MSAFQAAFEALRKTVGDVEADKLLTAVENEGRVEAAASVPGVVEFGTAFRATEQAPIEVHSPTASRNEAAARADRYRDMYPVVHVVQRTAHYGEWTEVTS
ncbi:hypothetical protein G6W57_01180 [Streptomyces sp. CAI-121]|uniref:hypothetical protein n=1 Tax=unclassified Streptomyces TaxID=2593676 RepID=UPI001587C9EE|nr:MULTISPECIES: hypothetical protein [unclassified Streptomyces]NUV65728.1 hypothetical protein [Streptomyces sp. CAI-121]NUW12465.1 hypothetical protein [Streptomyces sp. CAI-68]